MKDLLKIYLILFIVIVMVQCGKNSTSANCDAARGPLGLECTTSVTPSPGPTPSVTSTPSPTPTCNRCHRKKGKHYKHRCY